MTSLLISKVSKKQTSSLQLLKSGTVLPEANRDSTPNKLVWSFLMKFICSVSKEVQFWRSSCREWTRKGKSEWWDYQQPWQTVEMWLSGSALTLTDSSTSDHQSDLFLLKFTSKASVRNIIVLEWQPWINLPSITSKSSAMANLLSSLYPPEDKLDSQPAIW